MEQAIASWIQTLHNPDANVRTDAAEALAALGPEAAAAVPALVAALRDEDPNVRLAAASALGAIGMQGEVAIPALIEALRDKTCELEVSRSLSEFGLAAVPGIVQALSQAEYPEAEAILWVLSWIGPAALAEAMRNVGARRLIGLVYWLCGIGRGDLRAFLEDPEVRKNRNVVWNVLFALEELVRQGMLAGREEGAAVQALIAALRHDDPAVRRRAAEAVVEMGPESAAVPALTEALTDPAKDVRDAAAQALHEIGPGLL
jgi:HEAT repeat protein